MLTLRYQFVLVVKVVLRFGSFNCTLHFVILQFGMRLCQNNVLCHEIVLKVSEKQESCITYTL